MIARLKQGWLTLCLVLGALGVASSAPALAAEGDTTDPAEVERVRAELKRINALKEAGEAELAARRAARLCLQSPDPINDPYLACSLVRSDFKGTMAFEEVTGDLCMRSSARDCMALFFHLRKSDPQGTKEVRGGLLARACESDDADACGMLGVALLTGSLVPANRDTAKAVFERGCELRSAEVCQDYLELLTGYSFGTFTDDDVFTAAKGACAPNAERGKPDLTSAASCLAAAEAVEARAEGRDALMVLDFLDAACSQYRSAEACYWLAEDLENGDSGRVDSQGAKEALSAACGIKRDEEICKP